MGVIRADLPTTTDIAPENYIIIEKPGIGEGTYKGTIGDLQSGVTHDIEELQNTVNVLNDRLVAAERILAKVEEALMWKGTRSQWQSLTPAQRSVYKIVIQ